MGKTPRSGSMSPRHPSLCLVLLLSLGCRPPDDTPPLPMGIDDGWLERDDRLIPRFAETKALCGEDSVLPTPRWSVIYEIPTDCYLALLDVVNVQANHHLLESRRGYEGYLYAWVIVGLYTWLYTDLGSPDDLDWVAEHSAQDLIRAPFITEMQRTAAVHGYDDMGPLLFDITTSMVKDVTRPIPWPNNTAEAFITADGTLQVQRGGVSAVSMTAVEVLFHEATHHWLGVQANHVPCAFANYDPDIAHCDEDWSGAIGYGLGAASLAWERYNESGEITGIGDSYSPFADPAGVINEEYLLHQGEGE